MKWIGVDLDGTLAYFDKKKPHVIGEPIKPMLNFVKEIIDNDDYEVRIFTARAGDAFSMGQVRSWLNQQGLYGLTITNEKDGDMHAIFDDKAMRVEFNTGKICTCCLKADKDPKNMHSNMLSTVNTYGVSDPQQFLTDC
jgi:hypothetical protein